MFEQMAMLSGWSVAALFVGAMLGMALVIAYWARAGIHR
jgi:hypothetical protein